jgi:hypothetical protein
VNDALADDVAAGYVTPVELETLGDIRRRRAARRTVAARKGVAGDRLAARLQHAQIALAIADSSAGAGSRARSSRPRAASSPTSRTQLDALPDVTAQPAVAGGHHGGEHDHEHRPGTGGPPGCPFAPTSRIPPDGLDSWQAPNPAGPSTALAAGARAREVIERSRGLGACPSLGNGMGSGWVDARRLVPGTTPPA